MKLIPAILGTLIVLCLAPILLLIALVAETGDLLMGYPEPRK